MPRAQHPPAAELAKAARSYRGFHWGRGPEKVSRVRVPHPVRAPRVLYQLGTLRAVEYECAKGAEGPAVYRHEFRRPFPRLAADPPGRRLFVIGGGFRVEDRGIVH